MSTTNPPDGYTVVSGTTWGAGNDADREESVVDAGLYSLKFVSADSGVRSDYIAVSAATPYAALLRVRATSVFPSMAWFKFEWYTSAKALISSSSAFFTPTVVDSWESIRRHSVSPATAAYVRIVFGASSSLTTQTVYFSKVVLQPCGLFANVFNATATQSIPSGSWEIIELPDGDSAMNIFDGANDRYVATTKTDLLFSWGVVVDAINTDSYLETALFKGANEWAYGSKSYVRNGTSHLNSVGSKTISVLVGDIITLKAKHDHGSNRSTVYSLYGARPFLSITEVGR